MTSSTSGKPSAEVKHFERDKLDYVPLTMRASSPVLPVSSILIKVHKLKKRSPLLSELYEYCLKHKVADANLIAKWKKQGYENLCCLRCIQTRDTNFATNCICRVPKNKLEEGKIVECVHCGCRGCSG